MVDIEKLKKQIVEDLQPLNPKKIILFGSYAYGEPNENSDIDIFILKDDYDNKFKEIAKAKKMLSNIDMSKDILLERETFFNSHSNEDWFNSVWYNAAHYGKVLYEK
jgi:predicted nucleotidyltransferase